MNKNLIIVDGHNYLYRAYYGIPSSATLPNGTKINAYYGFMSFLRKVANKYKPNKLLVVFDSEKGISQKKKDNPDYKSNRNYIDKQIFEQLRIIKRALEYCKIKFIEDQRFEADDIIGSLSRIYSNSKYFVYISSNDNDFIQCVRNNIVLLKSVRGKDVEYTKKHIEEEFGFVPSLYLDYIALKGDPSDNIKGVPGIGKKTGTKLIQKYNGIEEILNTTISKSKEVMLIKRNKDKILSNKEILSINRNLEFKIDFKYTNTNLLFDKTSNEILKELKIY